MDVSRPWTSWLANNADAVPGWLGALRDRQIGRAVALIHREPARAWTVASLAAEAAMSRSAFSARFNALVGEPVMRYVARRRMDQAVTWLRERDMRIGEVAGALGYSSDAAFSRAFKRIVGVWPSESRGSRGQCR